MYVDSFIHLIFFRHNGRTDFHSIGDKKKFSPESGFRKRTMPIWQSVANGWMDQWPD